MAFRPDLMYRMIRLSPQKERQFTVINTTMHGYLTDRMRAMSLPELDETIVVIVNIGCPQRAEATWRIERILRADEWLREQTVPKATEGPLYVAT